MSPLSSLFGRLLVAGGLCWLTVKPVDLPGDRYELSAVVVNLTGRGNSGRQMVLGTSEWTLKPTEVDLEGLDAGEVMEEVARGEAPREVLAWIVLMKNGSDEATIRRWLEIATQEQDLERRGDYALVVVFAGLVGSRAVWQKAVEGLVMKEAEIVREWKDEARNEGRNEGRKEGRDEGRIQKAAEAVLRVLHRRGIALPEELATTVRTCPDPARLDGWLDAAAISTSLDEFRKETGL